MQIVDARHRESAQTPSFTRGSPASIPFSLVPVPGKVLVQPLQYTDVPPFILPTIQAPRAVTQGINPPQFVDARHKEQSTVIQAWLRSTGLPGAVIYPGGSQLVVLPREDIDDASALTIPGLIDVRTPQRNEVIIPPVEEFVPPPWVLSTLLAGQVAPVTTPPIGAQVFTQPVWEDTPYVWLRNWNGSPHAPFIRLPSGSILVVPPVFLHDETPYVWNWNGIPVIPGQRPGSGYLLFVQPQEEHVPFIFTSPGYGIYVPAPPPPPVPPGFVAVPNVVGLGWLHASHILELAGLNQDFQPLKVVSNVYPNYIVLVQDPPAGSIVQLTTNVQLTVSITSHLLGASFDVIPLF